MWQELKIVLSSVQARFNEDRCFRVASALSFTTVLALVPLVTVIVSMLSMFPVFEKWSDSVEAFIFSNFVPAAGDAVKGYLSDFSEQAGKLTAVGLVFLLLSSLFLLATIEDAFNDIWRVRKGRSMFQRLMVYWAVITLGPLLVTISLSMSATLLSAPVISNQSFSTTLVEGVLNYLPFLFELVTFMLFYQAIPNMEIRFRFAFAGALIAMVLFELAKTAFGYYIANFDSYQLIYGALATIPIFLLWVYLSWLVLLIGALFAAVGQERYEQEEEPVG